jgi:hypothetical protein
MIRGILKWLGIGGAATVAAVPMQNAPVEAPKTTQSDVARFFDDGKVPPRLETKMMPTTAMLEAYERANKPGAEKRRARRHHKQRVTKESHRR